jgi:putative hydrolase of the HAD superfamily
VSGRQKWGHGKTWSLFLTAATIDSDRLKVVVFDVDGTLYRQGPLRKAMLLRLLRLTAGRPFEGVRTFQTLQAYRRAQEDLREHETGGIAAAQLQLACTRTGRDRASVERCVERWMEQEPLSTMPRCRYEGLVDFLQACKARGLRLAALSDYPAAAKLEALGIGHLFDLVLCAQSPEVDVFKPNPRGLQVVVEQMGVFRHECLYVGDRAEVDAAAAKAAGLPCVILTNNKPSASDGFETVTSYQQLQDRLFGACHVPQRDVISSES